VTGGVNIYGGRGRFLIVAGALWALAGSIASAQTGGGRREARRRFPRPSRPGTSTSSGRPSRAVASFRVSRAFAGADVASRTGSKTVLGLGLTYELEEYSFSGPPA